MLRNNATSEIRKAQTNYYKSKIEENNGNNKRMWCTIKHLLMKRKSQCINNEDLSPSKFNQHFATIGAKLGAKFNTCNNLSWNLPESIYQFKFINADVEFIEKQLSLYSTHPNLDVLGFDSYLLHVGI